MGKIHKNMDRIVITKPDGTTIENNGCIFRAGMTDTCKLDSTINTSYRITPGCCHFGLTNIEVPENCPLRNGDVNISWVKKK
jgi:hypothetical protein